MTDNPFISRLARFRQIMEEKELDGFLVAVPENRYYLSGFEADDLLLTESSGFLFIAPGKQLLLTDFRYEDAARHEAPDYEVIVYKEGLELLLPELLSNTEVHRLGLEGHYCTYQRFLQVEKALHSVRPDAQVVAVENLVESMRIVKDAEEIDRIKASLWLTESVLAEVWDTLTPGQSEKEVAWQIESAIRRRGAEAVSFPPIVASGPNGALPHAVPGERRIESGDSVVVDIGSRLNRYCSDLTRTWMGGAVEPRLREIYKIVREAQLAAQDAICAGKDSQEVDQVAREIIGRAGYGEQFGHGLGHGVGLAVHEKPGFGKLSHMVLQVNMVMTVEPGIYLTGYGGVRLENMVRVTATGCELLNGLNLFYQS